MLSEKAEKFLWKVRFGLMERGNDQTLINDIEDELRDHLSEAEQRGESVEAIIDYSPKQYIDSLSREMNKEDKIIRYAMGILAFLFIVYIMPNMLSGRFKLTLTMIFGLIVTLCLFWLMWCVVKWIILHYAVEIRRKDTLPKKAYVYILFESVFTMGVLLGLYWIIKHYDIIIFFELSTHVSQIVGVILATVAAVYYIFKRNYYFLTVVLLVTVPNIVAWIIVGRTTGNDVSVMTGIVSLFCLFIVFLASLFIGRKIFK